MIPTRPDMRLTGAVVLRDGTFQQRSVAIANGRISRGPLPEVDLSGYLILPGIVDLHGTAPRRRQIARAAAVGQAKQALAFCDRAAAAAGITTAWLEQGWSWEGGIDAPEAALRMLNAVRTHQPCSRTDLRVQLRVETHMPDSADRLLATIAGFGVDNVVFSNRIEAAARLAKHGGTGFAEAARAAHRSPAEHLVEIERARSAARRVPRHLCRLAEAFDGRGLVYGSLRDPDAETRETFSILGAKPCFCPATGGAARLARAVNDPVLLSASQLTGRAADTSETADLVAAGHVDALVSDAAPGMLAEAAFDLVAQGVMPLARAWALISEAPATIMRMTDRGRIDYGLRADLTVVDAATRTVEATLVAGRPVHLSGAVARRFDAVWPGQSLAAE